VAKDTDVLKGLTAEQFVKKLTTHRSSAQRAKYQRAFKHGEDDEFMGVGMGRVFALAKEFIEMPLGEIEKLLESPIHEARVGAVSVMDFQARSKKTSGARRKELFDLYLRRHDRINNWDLVDRSAPYVVGGYLFDKPRKILYKLAHSKNIWERRTAIVSTGYFIRKGDIADTFKIAEILLKDDQDLIHKATGWMLRAAGGIDRQTLLNFLDKHAATMPRTCLRYAIEHLDQKRREHYLNLKKDSGA
jgi:3-methyladenine DNA glycosylase AlkD